MTMKPIFRVKFCIDKLHPAKTRKKNNESGKDKLN